jgi:ABC-2 type transport system permease protein
MEQSMSARLTLATAGRVLRQIRHDPRTIAMMLVVPCVLLGLLAWLYDNTPVFDQLGAPLLGVFPFVVMFLITSVATLRERQSCTLERLLTMPLAKADLIGGYALAFGLLATVQAVVASVWAVYVLDLNIAGPLGLLVAVAVVDAVLGSALGLFVSAFARSEFQAVQFMPAFVLPQFLLAGLLTPRDEMPDFLSALSDVLPLSYAVDAMKTLTVDVDPTGDVLRDVGIVVAFVAGALALGAATLRRRTP